MIDDPRNRIGLLGIGFAIGFHSIVHLAICSAAEDPALNQMWAVWRNRSKGTANLRFNLMENVTGIGAFCRHRSEWARQDSDIDRIRYGELVVSQDNIRFNSKAWEYDDRLLGIIPFYRELYSDRLRDQLTAKRFDLALFDGFRNRALELRAPADYVSVFDGQRRVALWARPSPQLSRAVLWHSPPFYRYGDLYFHAFLEAVPSLDDIVYVPVLMMYRPFHPWYGGIDPDRCSLMRRGVMIDGHECYPHLQIDVDYEKDRNFGWVPHHWTINRFDGSTGAIFEAVRIETAEFQINEAITGSHLFSIDFPERTWVCDFEHTEQFLVAKDGSRRRILDFEFRAGSSDAQLLASAPGESGDIPTASIGDYVWWHSLCQLAMGAGGVMFAIGAARLRKSVA
jgi:hypothetical protein